MQLKRALIICYIVGSVQPAFAQTDSMRCWSLDACIAYAQEHNIEIKTQELTAESKRITFSESKWAYAPDVSVSNGYNVSSGRVLDPTTYSFVENQTVQGNNTSISAGFTLFGGMSNLHNLRRAKLDLQAELLGVEKTRNDVTLNITAYYLEILCAEESIRNAEQIVATLQIQEEKTAKQVEVRKVTTADLLQIQSQLANAENEVLTARNQLYIAKLNLCQLLEIEDYMNFRTATPEKTLSAIDLLPHGVDEVVEAAHSLPQVRIAELEIDIARRDVRIAQAAYYPTLSIGAAYGSSFSDARQKTFQNADGTYRFEAYPFFEQYKDNANKYLSVSLNVPIFGRLTARKRVQKQKIAVQQAQYALQTMRKQVTKEVNQAWIDTHTAWEKYRSSQKFVATATEAARQVERKYELGVATVVDYNTALDNLVKANSQLLQAKYEYLFKTRIIRFYQNSQRH
ncbi:MAG: TolC family protein [Alistipes sp.]